MKRCSSQQRDTIVKPLVFHQRIDPPHWIGCPDDLVFGTKNEKEAVAGVGEATFMSLSEILCLRHNMTDRSHYADQTQTVRQGGTCAAAASETSSSPWWMA